MMMVMMMITTLAIVIVIMVTIIIIIIIIIIKKRQYLYLHLINLFCFQDSVCSQIDFESSKAWLYQSKA